MYMFTEPIEGVSRLSLPPIHTQRWLEGYLWKIRGPREPIELAVGLLFDFLCSKMKTNGNRVLLQI